MKIIYTSLMTLLLSAIMAFSAEPINIDPANTNVEFLAKGSPGFLKIHGTEGRFKGGLTLDGTQISGELTADLNLFKTGIELRDEHMKEKYLETGKFPHATLKVEAQKINPAITDKQQLQGTLTLHGVTKPVTITIEVKKQDAAKYQVQSSFKITLSDYGIDVPKYLGVTVAEDVTIEARLQADANKTVL